MLRNMYYLKPFTALYRHAVIRVHENGSWVHLFCPTGVKNQRKLKDLPYLVFWCFLLQRLLEIIFQWSAYQLDNFSSWNPKDSLPISSVNKTQTRVLKNYFSKKKHFLKGSNISPTETSNKRDIKWLFAAVTVTPLNWSVTSPKGYLI